MQMEKMVGRKKQEDGFVQDFCVENREFALQKISTNEMIKHTMVARPAYQNERRNSVSYLERASV